MVLEQSLPTCQSTRAGSARVTASGIKGHFPGTLPGTLSAYCWPACTALASFLMNSQPACASCLPAPDLPAPAAGLPTLTDSPPALDVCWHPLPAPALTRFCLPTHPAPACTPACLQLCLPTRSGPALLDSCTRRQGQSGTGEAGRCGPQGSSCFPPPRALPAEARVAPLPAPLGTCYSWQRQLENGRQRRNFVCSELGSGQTSGLQLSGAQDRSPVPPVRPRHPSGRPPRPGQASACPDEGVAPPPLVC